MRSRQLTTSGWREGYGDANPANLEAGVVATPRPSSVSVETNYGDWTKADLQDELEKRDLPKSGNKDELIARLNEADAA